MQTVDPTIHELFGAFQQDLYRSNRFFREAAAAAAIEQAVHECEQVTKPQLSLRWQLVRATGRALVCSGQWLMALADPQLEEYLPAKHWQVSGHDPITIDVYPDPASHYQPSSPDEKEI